jgi:hypothetical protein
LTASQKKSPVTALTCSDKCRRFLAAYALFGALIGAHTAECRRVNHNSPGILLWIAVKRNEKCG